MRRVQAVDREGKGGYRERHSFPASRVIRHQSAGTGRSVSKIDVSGQVSFSESVAAAQRSLQPPELVLDLTRLDPAEASLEHPA